MIGSFGMALRYSFGLHEAADRLDAAIASVLAAGLRTADIRAEDGPTVSTSEMGDAIVTELARQASESVTDEEN
jgi:3-isopropylmalate dehydrogenase